MKRKKKSDGQRLRELSQIVEDVERFGPIPEIESGKARKSKKPKSKSKFRSNDGESDFARRQRLRSESSNTLYGIEPT